MELKGDLQSFPLVQLIQTLENSQRTGKLNIEGTMGTCTIFFQKGKVIHAQSPYGNGQGAFFDVFLEREGTFSFGSGVIMPPVTITQGNASLLLQASAALAVYSRDELRCDPVRLEVEPLENNSDTPVTLTEDEFRLLQETTEPVTFDKILREMECGFFRTWTALKALAEKKMVKLSKMEA